MKISIATNHIELNNHVEEEAARLNCKLDDSMTYVEQAKFFEDEAANPKNDDDADALTEMARILRAAEARWFELDG